jgi:hypothetical protein
MKTGSWFRSSSNSNTSQIPYIMGLFISFGGGAMYGYKVGRGQIHGQSFPFPADRTPLLEHNVVGTRAFYANRNSPRSPESREETVNLLTASNNGLNSFDADEEFRKLEGH